MQGNFRWLFKFFAFFLVIDAATAFTPVWPIQKHLRSQSSHQMNDLTVKKFFLGSQAFAHPVSFYNYGRNMQDSDGASPNDQVGILVKELEKQKQDVDLKFTKQKQDFDLKLTKQIEDVLEEVNRQLWPIFRAHCISLAVQVLLVFYGDQPKGQPKNVRSLFNDGWLTDNE